MLAAAAIAPPGAHAAGMDGPGSYVAFRTYPALENPTAEQNRRCEQHFGPARAALTVRQHALEYAPRFAPSGVAVDETARYLGPAFVCATIGPTTDLIDAFGVASLPRVGTAGASGPCSPAPSMGGVVFLGCRLTLHPDPAIGLEGGFAMQAAVSGSLIVGYLLGRPASSPPDAEQPGPPRGQLPNDPDFHLWRTLEESAETGTCGEPAAAARRAVLSAAQPSLFSGLLDPEELLHRDAAVSLCLGDPGSDRHPASAVLDLTRGGRPLRVVASGDCRDAPTAAGDDMRQRSCSLSVRSATAPGFRGGLVTSTGLVRAGDRLEAANSHVWTLALLADLPPEPVDSEAPTVTVDVPRRARRPRLRVRWAGSDAGSGIRSYDVELRRRGRGHRWRAAGTALTTTDAELHLRPGRPYLVRVRAHDRADNVGPWAVRSVPVR